jgi:hypothetical protein
VTGHSHYECRTRSRMGAMNLKTSRYVFYENLRAKGRVAVVCWVRSKSLCVRRNLSLTRRRGRWRGMVKCWRRIPLL